MEVYFKLFLFKILAPMFYLVFFAYAFTSSALKLSQAWQKKDFKKIWLYLWIILVGIYFFSDF